MEKYIDQTELKNGTRYIFENEERALEVQYVEHRNNWGYPFLCWFNGEYHSYRTFKGLENKVNGLIRKYDLLPTSNENQR